ncbi:MAG: hypothetical protein J0L94_01185 [Rhodothermia bacterium]|nr:hypothetical protein [Rhodothermia bacterium]
MLLIAGLVGSMYGPGKVVTQTVQGETKTVFVDRDVPKVVEVPKPMAVHTVERIYNTRTDTVHIRVPVQTELKSPAYVTSSNPVTLERPSLLSAPNYVLTAYNIPEQRWEQRIYPAYRRTRWGYNINIGAGAVAGTGDVVQPVVIAQAGLRYRRSQAGVIGLFAPDRALYGGIYASYDIASR